MSVLKRKRVKIVIISLAAFILIASILLVVINAYVCSSSEKYFLTKQECTEKQAEYILVLGAKVYPNGRLSMMLDDRVTAACTLYDSKAAPKIIMSGDSSNSDYDEVNPMRNRANELGVPKEHILIDTEGLSTYDSIIRVRDIFKAKKIIIVTQEYHLYRAVYVARKLGIEAYGYPSEKIEYYGQFQRDVRETLARVKDFFYAGLKN